MKMAPPGTIPFSGLPLSRAGVSLSTTRSTCSSSARGWMWASDVVEPFLAVLAGHRVAEGGLDLAGQVVARGRQRVVHPLDDGDGPAAPQGLDDRPRREGAEAADVQAAGLDPLDVAQVVDRGAG